MKLTVFLAFAFLLFEVKGINCKESKPMDTNYNSDSKITLELSLIRQQGFAEEETYKIHKENNLFSLNYYSLWFEAGKEKDLERNEIVAEKDFAEIWNLMKKYGVFEKDFSKKETSIRGSHSCKIYLTVDSKKLVNYSNVHGAEDDGGKLFDKLWGKMKEFKIGRSEEWSLEKSVLNFQKMSKENPDLFFRQIETSKNFQGAEGDKLKGILSNMLDDKRLLKAPNPFMHTEEKPVRLRVCDKAYIFLRNLVVKEKEETAFMNEDRFREMTESEKDVEIKKYKESGVFRSLI
jgi:hypothetical protein